MATVETAAEEFLLGCQVDRLAAKTIAWYRTFLNHLVAAYGGHQVQEVSPHDMRVFLARFGEQDYSDHTISDANRAMHRFWSWVADEYEIRNPMRNIRYLQPPAGRAPRAVSLDDVIKMFHAAKGGMYTERDQAILAFALDTGARAGGICNLLAADIDFERRKALVTEKGNKTRAIAFTPVTAALLLQWMEKRTPGAQVMFYSTDTLEAMSVNSLGHLFRRLRNRAGLKGKTSPHTFRHFFGREYVKAGGDVITLARIMGHTDVNTTAKYYALFTNDEISAAHEKYSPMNQLVEALGDELDS